MTCLNVVILLAPPADFNSRVKCDSALPFLLFCKFDLCSIAVARCLIRVLPCITMHACYTYHLVDTDWRHSYLVLKRVQRAHCGGMMNQYIVVMSWVALADLNSRVKSDPWSNVQTHLNMCRAHNSMLLSVSLEPINATFNFAYRLCLHRLKCRGMMTRLNVESS